MTIIPPRIGPQPWDAVRTKLDQSLPFANMRDTPYYRDAVWEQFSKAEYERRYRALRAKMREDKLDAVIVPGGPSHWSFGGGMLWLTGHWEWHALASYVLVPLEGEPTMIYSMGGTHAEAVRRQVEVAVKDVRHSRSGRYADIMVERMRELKLERGRIGLMEIDPRHGDYMPVNQYNVLRDNLPDAELVFTKGFLHELLSIHSAEELDCVRKAGVLCKNAMDAMVARAAAGREGIRAARRRRRRHPGGRRRYRLSDHRLNADGQSGADFRQSAAVVARAEKGRHHQHGAGRRLSRLHRADRLADLRRRADRDGEEILARRSRCRATSRIVAEIAPGKPVETMRSASKFFRDNGYQSRPTQCHGIDLVTDKPHVVAEHVAAEEIRASAKARHGDHGRAQPDHAGRPVRHFPRPHLHRHRQGPRSGRRVSAGDRGGGRLKLIDRLDVVGLDHFGPFGDFGVHELLNSGCVIERLAPCSSQASLMSGRDRILLISVLSFSTIGFGVPAGAMKPTQSVA